jgi:GT2 family glycosyltransferase
MTARTDDGGTGAPSVLVVIVNYNGGELLARAVAAMKLQTFTNYRLIVVDNASSDDSIALMKAGNPGVEVLPAGSNLGFAAANNLAVRRYPGSRWIALLNPDAFPEPPWLQVLVDAAQARSDAAAFASRTIDAGDDTLLDGAGDACHISGRYWRRGHRCSASRHYLQREEIFSACAAAALYSRPAWEQVGGLDEDFFCYGEDVDLGFRLQLAGYKCLYVADAIARHYGSAVTGERSDFSTYHGQRNLVWVYVKNMPPLLFWSLLPYHLVLNLAALIGCALRGQGRVAFKAKVDALRGLARAWRKRRSIQRVRRVSAARIWSLLDGGWPGPRC